MSKQMRYGSEEEDDDFMYDVFVPLSLNEAAPAPAANNNISNNNQSNIQQGVAALVAEHPGFGAHPLTSKAIEDLINGESSTVTLPTATFGRLIQSSVGPVTTPPSAFVVQSASYEGKAEKSHISMRVELTFVKLDDKWALTPLLSLRVELRDVAVLVDGEARSDAVVTTQGTCYALAGASAGTYTVSLNVAVPYASRGNRGFVMAVPKAPRNSLTLTVDAADAQFKVNPSIYEETTSEGETSTVTCGFPASDSVRVQWTEKQAEEDIPEEEAMPLMVTAEQKTLVSLGEGMLLSACVLNYTIRHGAVSSLTLAIDERVRVLSVKGDGMKKWDVLDRARAAGVSTPGVSEDEWSDVGVNVLGGGEFRILKVWLEYSVEDSYKLEVFTEMDLGDTSAQTSVPNFVCRGIDREKGYVAVEASTSVEVQELSSSQLSTIDVSELPVELRNAASNPLLFGYKFLDPNFSLALDVTRHEDVSVLTAVVEGAHYTETVTQEGRRITKGVFRIRNAQRQYLRIRLSPEAEIWSTIVSGQPVKPAMDTSDGSLMIPLSKNSTAVGGASFVAEVVYVSEGEALGRSGVIDFTFPTVDLPINHLFITTNLPNDADYGEFTGTIKEVPYFTASPPVADNYYAAPVADAAAGGAPIPMSNAMPQMQAQVQSMSSRGARKRKMKGMLPVAVAVPASGIAYSFEQLLVVNTVATLSVPFQVRSKGFLATRRVPVRVLGFHPAQIAMAAVVLAAAAWYFDVSPLTWVLGNSPAPV